MRIEKAPANQENIFYQFDSRWCKCSQHNQIHFICSAFLFWLCCEHLKHVHCKIEEVVSLICRCFVYLQHVELSRPPYYRLGEMIRKQKNTKTDAYVPWTKERNHISKCLFHRERWGNQENQDLKESLVLRFPCTPNHYLLNINQLMQ